MVQLSEAGPLADRLERLTNQLVNVAEADMLERIEASQRAYGVSRMVVVAFALGSIVLALGLGYVFSWSIVGPLTQIADAAAPDRGRRLHRARGGRQPRRAGRARGRRQPHQRGAGEPLSADRGAGPGAPRSARAAAASSEVLSVISRSTSDLQPVLDTIVATAARLCHAEWTTIFKLEPDGKYHLAAASEAEAAFHGTWRKIRSFPGGERSSAAPRSKAEPCMCPTCSRTPIHLVRGASQGRRANRARRAVAARDAVLGVIHLHRSIVRPFTEKEIELVTTFADQAVIAIENVRLFEEVQARTRELTEALEQQTATSAILRVISTSPTDVQPVFETIVRNAVALCGSLFAIVFRFDGELLHFVASQNVGPDYAELLRAKYPMRPTLPRYPDEPSSPDRWSDWRTLWPIRTTISGFPRP